MDRFESAAAELDTEDELVARYVAGRRDGALAVARSLDLQGDSVEGALVLVRPGVAEQERIQGASTSFVRCVLAHVWTMGQGLMLAGEIPNSDPWVPPEGDLCVRFESGPFRLDGAQVVRAAIGEVSVPDGQHERCFMVVMRQDEARQYNHLNPGAGATLTLMSGRASVWVFRGIVDAITPSEGEPPTLEIRGQDTLTGSRVHIRRRFNCHVDPTSSVLCLAAFIDTRQFAEGLRQPDLSSLSRWLLDGVPDEDVPDVQAAITAIGEAEPELGDVSRAFASALQPGHPVLSLAALAFSNIASVVVNNLNVYVAIGSVARLACDGIVRVAPGVAVAGPGHLPVWWTENCATSLGEDPEPTEEAKLISSWDPDASHLVTFFTADSAPATVEAGWSALELAYNLLRSSLCDSSWVHGELVFPVATRLRDARLRLQRGYHVHELLTGMAHQYEAGRSLVTETLVLDDDAVGVLRPRLDHLGRRLSPSRTTAGRQRAQLRNAIAWLVRGQDSATPSESFLCTWIAVEYVLVGPSATAESIQGVATKRAAELMSRGDRTRRKYWNRVLSDAYATRCRLVHEADEGDTIEELLTLIQQIALEAVWRCASLLEGDEVPDADVWALLGSDLDAAVLARRRGSG